MAKVEATLFNIKSIFQNPRSTKFKIPSFQRRFVWNRDNVLDMFDDFAEDSNNYTFETTDELNGYLLGSIVFIDSNNSSGYIVVDGQQRLTTLTLIFKCMANRYKKLIKQHEDNGDNDEYVLSFAEMQPFYYSNSREKVLKIEQNPELSYAKVYKDIINDRVDLDDVNDYKDSNILEVWEEINNQISSFSTDELLKFDEYLQDNVKLIKIVCPDENQALQLFEVLNNRGQSLEPLDLIKNMFLQLVDGKSNINQFDKYWKTFSENMYIRKNNKGKASNHSSLFLKYFIMGHYGENQKRKKLVEFFRNKIKGNYINSKNILNFVKQLSEYSKIYKSMVENPAKNNFSDSTYMYSLSLLNIKQFHQLLMMFYFTKYANKSDLQEAREKVLLACIKMGLSTLYNHDLPNEIEKAMTSIVTTFKDSLAKTSDLQIATDHMIEVMKKYDESKSNSIIATLPYLKLGKKKAVDLLKIFEILFNKNNGISTKQAKGKTITLEHILPQSMPESVYELGFNPEDDYSSVINNIGNLTLLHKDDNDSLSNGVFSLKKRAYGETDIMMTRAINGKYKSVSKSGNNAKFIKILTDKYERSYEKNDKWTKACIKQRGLELTKLLVDFTTDRIKISD